MSVACPRCGRPYAAERFSGGRTLWCACGARVAGPAAARPLPEPLRFAADAMLGRLARWLRLLSLDTSWSARVADAELARLAHAEDRVLLTRDRRLPEDWRVPHHLWIEPEEALAQLRQIVSTFGIDWRRGLFTRCPVCNALVERVPLAAVEDLVPERVARTERELSRCPGCGKVYWPGSHVERIRATLERELG